MENQKAKKNYSSYYIIPGLICGILTGWIFTESVGYAILGGVVGLLAAGFWMNVVMDNGEEA
jgi:hypothetical protein